MINNPASLEVGDKLFSSDTRVILKKHDWNKNLLYVVYRSRIITRWFVTNSTFLRESKMLTHGRHILIWDIVGELL